MNYGETETLHISFAKESDTVNEHQSHLVVEPQSNNNENKVRKRKRNMDNTEKKKDAKEDNEKKKDYHVKYIGQLNRSGYKRGREHIRDFLDFE